MAAEASLPDADEELSYEEALDLVGTGRAQRRLLLICALGNAADAVELLSISLVLPAIGEEAQGSLRLSLGQKATLSAALFWGALLGTLLWGFMSDIRGRRRALTLSMAISGGFGLLSAFATSFGWLVALRTLAGVGVGGSVPVIFAFLSELVCAAKRGKYLCILASFWMVGSIATALAGLCIVPSHPREGWRFFLSVAALPSLACAFFSHTVAPESPRWLLIASRRDEAAAELRRAAVLNGTSAALPAALKLRASGSAAGDELSRSRAAVSLGGGDAGATLAHLLRAYTCALRSLLSRPMLNCTLSLAAVWAGISFGWYGTVLWFPTYLSRRSGSAPPPPSPPGATPGLDAYAFEAQLAIACSNLPGNLLSLWLIDAVGRRRTLAYSLAGGAGAALLFAFAPPGSGQGLQLFAACLFNGVSVAAWNGLDAYSSEVLPTSLRTTGLGVFSACGRLGSILSQYSNGLLLPLAEWAPLLPGAGAMLAGAAVVARLPRETAGRAMADDVCDVAGERREGGEVESEGLLRAHGGKRADGEAGVR